MIFRPTSDDDGGVDHGPRVAQALWIVSTVCGIVLCMLDLSSLLGGSSSTSSFGLLSFAKATMSIDSMGMNLLTGYFFVCFWMYSRESNMKYCAAWCSAQIVLGNVVLCVYVLKALYNSNGNWREFWQGQNNAPNKVDRML